ncbi:MAG: NPCBM/NEW2 domain-containing protein, partial [Armatimonadetes bacterium]|nr:NPCBM/NEW2 domain-containing protein [Armatimonadota bacterium]
MRLKHRLLKAMVMALVTTSQAAHGVSVRPDEMALVRRWTSAKFEGTIPSEASQSGLVVIANNDVVQRNSRAGKPLNITGKLFTRGLYCHAVSKVIVKLPGPGKTFSAIVGVDSNDQTSGGRGSVVFSVSNQGKEVFRSDVLREGHAPVTVKVDLNGSSEFTIEVGDAGDGITCDQADWADAQVELKDGSVVWLGDLPILGGESRTFAVGAPFSFKYGGQDSRAFLNQWKAERTSKKLDANRTQRMVKYTDPETGLVVRCEAVEYLDFPTVEWTLHLKNTGSAETPIISDIRPLDSEFARTGAEEFVLHHNTGSPYSPTDYQPFQTPLGRNASKRITTSGGRSSNSDLPYFNIERPGGGLIAVIGWPGQWAAKFERDDKKGLRIRGGQ